MTGFRASVQREWRAADEDDRRWMRWGALVGAVYAATAIAALIMQVTL